MIKELENINELIKKHLEEPFHPSYLASSSVKHFSETGEISGTFYLAIKELLKEYSDQQNAELKDKLEMKTFQLKAADSDYQNQIKAKDKDIKFVYDTMMEQKKWIEENNKEIEELKIKLANNCTCTESIICEQCLSK